MGGAAAELLASVAEIARRAAAEILAVYDSGASDTRHKSDASPLTEADLRAHRLILAALAQLTPQLPVLSEESPPAAFAARRSWPRYWLVDPLDGTREFLGRNGEFTVNIALIEDHRPTLGVVHVPVRNVSYQGLPGSGAWRQPREGARQPIRRGCRGRLSAPRAHERVGHGGGARGARRGWRCGTGSGGGAAYLQPPRRSAEPVLHRFRPCRSRLAGTARAAQLALEEVRGCPGGT